jgi:CheY-like chemotaxis protein
LEGAGGCSARALGAHDQDQTEHQPDGAVLDATMPDLTGWPRR